MKKIFIIFCSSTKLFSLTIDEEIKNNSELHFKKEFVYIGTPKELIIFLQQHESHLCFVVCDTLLNATHDDLISGALEISTHFSSSINSKHSLVFFAPTLEMVSQEPHRAINSLDDNANKKLQETLREFFLLS